MLKRLLSRVTFKIGDRRPAFRATCFVTAKAWKKACYALGSTTQVGLTQALDVQNTISPSAKLEAALSDTSEGYVNAGTDASTYYARLADNIRKNQCEPFIVTAMVKEPGFPDAPVGSTIYGDCVAQANGYWLVYHSEQDRFYCFWGVESSNLGAHGVFGSPLYCWSA